MFFYHIQLVYSPNLWDESLSRMLLIFLYLGPETIMPLASILAAVLGFLLIFWHRIAKFVKRIFKRPEEKLIEPDAAESESEKYVDPLDE